jgi:competence protein ComEC
VSFLDVGQGDATLVQDPAGAAVLFDGGRAEARVVRLLEQAGVERLSLMVSTHQSADHHGGLLEVVQRIPVDVLLANPQGTDDRTYRALMSAAKARGAHVIRAAAGQSFGLGSLRISILSPPGGSANPPPADPNPLGVVAVVSSGEFDLFLSADAESPALIPLDLPDVEAMKVPHHGSEDPGLGDVLERLRPAVAVIEVGKENSYGHPRPETLATLDRFVPHVRRTDRDGTVQLVVDGAAMAIR